MGGGGGVEGGACPSSGSVPRASVEDRRRWDGMDVARVSRAQVPLLP